MTRKKPESIFIVPPPGPLAWLHPEFIRVSRWPAWPDGRPDRTSPSPSVDAILNLCRTGLSGAQLIDTLAGQHTDRIIIEDGPRGHSLWSWLSQCLRNTGIDLRQPSPIPPPPLERPEVQQAGDNQIRPLESLLTAAAGQTGEGEVVIVERLSAGTFQFKTVSLLAALHESQPLAGTQDPATLRLLPLRPGDGLEQHLEITLDVVSRHIASLRYAGIVPYFVTSPTDMSSKGYVEHNPRVGSQRDTGRMKYGHEVETRLLPSWWGVLPGDSYTRSVRKLYRKLIRLLSPDRMFLFLAFENYALAGIDLYAESLMGRFVADTPPPPALITGSTAEANAPHLSNRNDKDRKPLVIGVCGIDGSGKSSHVAALEHYLVGRGLRTSVQKIYRHGVFHDTVTDLTRQCAGGRNLHLWRIQRMAKAFDSVKYFYAAVESDLASCDAVIFDRYLFTHYAAGVGRYHHDPFTRELLAVFPPADRIYLLDVPPEEALRRIEARDEKTVDENPYMLSRYRHALLDLGDRHGFFVLDGRKSFEENSRIILEDAARLVVNR